MPSYEASLILEHLQEIKELLNKLLEKVEDNVNE